MHRTPTPQQIGSRIESGRLALGLSRERVASELGISLDTLIRYERGRTDPSFRQVAQLSLLLEQPLEFFFASAERVA